MFHTMLLATPGEQFNAFFKALNEQGSIVQHDGYLTVEDISITEFYELFEVATAENRASNPPVRDCLKSTGMIPVSLKNFLAPSASTSELASSLAFVEDLMDHGLLKREGRQWRLDSMAESTCRREQVGLLARLLVSQAVTDRMRRGHVPFDNEPF